MPYCAKHTHSYTWSHDAGMCVYCLEAENKRMSEMLMRAWGLLSNVEAKHNTPQMRAVMQELKEWHTTEA